MSHSQTRQAEVAAESLANGSVIGMGEYRTVKNGKHSLKSVLAKTWCREHDLGPKENLLCWMDPNSGALIILPKSEAEGEYEH